MMQPSSLPQCHIDLAKEIKEKGLRGESAYAHVDDGRARSVAVVVAVVAAAAYSNAKISASSSMSSISDACAR